MDPKTIRNLATEADDFGHQLRVGNMLSSIPDLHSTHGGTYVDSITQKPREFDFRCTIRKGDLVLHLAVECKNLSKDAPVVICGVSRNANEAFHDIIQSSFGRLTRGGSVIDGWYSETRRLPGSRIYREGEFSGKSVIKIKPAPNGKGSVGKYKTEQDTDIYDRWNQALSSAYDLCKTSAVLARDYRQRHIFSAIIPTVVVADGSLWELRYDQDGTIREDPRQSHHCEYFVDRRLKATGWDADQECSLSHIHFFTLSGLKSWTGLLHANQAWTDWFPPESVGAWRD